MSIILPSELGLGGENSVLEQRPYISTNGKLKGQKVVSYNTGQLDENGFPVYAEKLSLTANASTLRKDEWINLDDRIQEAARERLVVVEDLMAAGLTYNVGGLGTIISEWEEASEMTDAEVTMDGESKADKDRQNFDLAGVPVPIIQKPFSIGQRMLMSSRQRGAGLDVTQGVEAARAVARVSESIVFNGSNIGASDSAGNKYTIPGLTNFAGRGTYTISDWSNAGTSNETILTEILAMINVAETQERHFGPFNLYIPAAYAARFRQDFKANSDKTLMMRALEIDAISKIRVSDVLATGNVVLVEMSAGTIDLAIASDLTTVQWQSGSGWTNHFQTFASWAPRIKQDYDSRCGVVHGTTA